MTAAELRRKRRIENLPAAIRRARGQREYVANLRWRGVVYGLFGLQLGGDAELDAAIESFRARRLAHLDGIIASAERQLAEHEAAA